MKLMFDCIENSANASRLETDPGANCSRGGGAASLLVTMGGNQSNFAIHNTLYVNIKGNGQDCDCGPARLEEQILLSDARLTSLVSANEISEKVRPVTEFGPVFFHIFSSGGRPARA